VQDTLGTVLLMTGKPKEAVPHFERALQRSTDPRSALTIAIHLTDACVQSENFEGAKVALSSIDALQQRTPGLFTEEITKQVQELRSRLEGK
jgi:hypothetical protein